MRHEATDVTGLQVNQRQVSSPCTRRVKASRPAACWSWQKGLGAAAVWTHGRSIVGKKLSNSRCRDGRLFCSLAGRKGVNFPLHGALSRLVGQHARVRAFSFGGVAGSLPNSQFYVFTQIHPSSPVFVLGDWPRAPAARRVLVGARRLVCFSSEGTQEGSTGKGGGVASQCGLVLVGAVPVLRAGPDPGRGDRLMRIRRMRVGGGIQWPL
jgi:hypothetical protein